MTKEKIILDCDPGHDDAVALMMAGRHPQLELLAVTTVAGNQTIEKTTTNALHLVEYLGLNVPVARGASGPLLAPQITAADIHGQSGLDGPVFPPLKMREQDLFALDFIAAILSNSCEPITLVATGPLTNIALLLQSRPYLKNRIAKIVLMGGAIGLGNVTPAAEFNIRVDPEAAAIVFQSGLPLVMMGLDLTHQAVATSEVLERVRELDNFAAQLFVEMMSFFTATQKDILGCENGPPVHDPTTIAYLLNPELISTQEMFVSIDTSGGPSYGRTLCDVCAVTGKKPNCAVATTLDVNGFWQLVIDSIDLYAQERA